MGFKKGSSEDIVNYHAFKDALHTEEMQKYLRGIDIDPADGPHIFQVLDIDDSGELTKDEIHQGLIRLRKPVTALQLAVVEDMIQHLFKTLEDHHCDIQEYLKWVGDR